MNLERIPPLSASLIAALDSAYPARCISPGQSYEDAHRYAAKRELIDSLITIQTRTDANVLA